MNQLELISSFCDETAEKFNDSLINFKKEESIVEHIADCCKALEYIPQIKFLGIEHIKDETKTKDWDTVNIETTRADEIIIKFEITFNDEVVIVEKNLLVPKLIDNHYFVINDVKYFPISQIVDRGVFVTPRSYSLKTLLMPIRFKYKKIKIKDEFGDIMLGYRFQLNLFKRSISCAYYFLAKFGLDEVLENKFGNLTDYIEFADVEESEVLESEKVWSFNIYKNYWMFVKKDIPEGLIPFVISLYDVFIENKKSFEQAIFETETVDEEVDIWKKTLGKVFTKSTNSMFGKGEKVLNSLERILDEKTKKILIEISDKDKGNIFSMLSWMINNFNKFKYQDNMDLRNKRIQYIEYIIQPLLRLFSNGSYRIMNTRNVTIKTFSNIFNIGPNFLIKKVLNNELIRYSGAVNNIDLFNSALKITFKGLGSIADGSEVSDKFRGIHKSYVGNLSLITTSSGDPGLTTTIIPFTTIKNGRFIFDDGEKIK